MTISEFDRKITFNQYAFAQDSSGGNIKGLFATFDTWAKVEPVSNSRTLEQMQITYSEAYRVTTRYEISRQITGNDEIIYEGRVLSIAGIREETEGRKKYNIITAYSTGKSATEGEELFQLCGWKVIEW